jgi:hypothetical protein
MMNQIRKHLDPLLTDMGRSPGFYLWVSFLVALIFLGGYALLMSLIHSMEILEFSTNAPWEMMVSNYVFLVGSSIGLCLVSSLGFVFGLKRYELIGKRGLFLALITIIFGLSSINLHLGHPERAAFYTALTPNVRSAMWYMGTLYPPYIVFVAVCFWLFRSAVFLAPGQGRACQNGSRVRWVEGQGLPAHGPGGVEGLSLPTPTPGEVGGQDQPAPAFGKNGPLAGF